MRAAFIDLDGVVYEGERAVAGAARAIAWLEERSVPHLFLTNTTSRPRIALVEKLAGLGIEARLDQILTPPSAATSWLAEHAPGPAALFVPEATAPARSLNTTAAAPDSASGARRGVSANSFALGMTRYWRAADGLRLDVASFVKALEHASGARSVVLGKPAPEFFCAGLARVDCPPHEAVLIGDDIVGDVQGAQSAGLRGILVRTGKFRASDLEGGIRPDAVLDSIADFPGWWQLQLSASGS